MNFLNNLSVIMMKLLNESNFQVVCYIYSTTWVT